MADNSDYKKTRIDLKKLIAQSFATETNKSLADNLYNRFLSKDEMENVYGIVGEINPAANTNRHIPESTPHRSAFQLQPLLYKKIATVDNMMSYKDILQRAALSGVDKNRLKEWGNTEQFNFVPPVDLDKLTNYVKYYWYNPANPLSTPQYITIKNRCTVAQSALNAKLIELGGQYQYTVLGYDSINNSIDILGSFASVFNVAGTQFQIQLSTNNDNTYTSVSAQSIGANTRIFVVENIDDTVIDGQVAFEEVVSPLLAERDCACYGSVGWGINGYDSQAFDGDPACTVQSDSWYSENFWVHQADIPAGGFVIAKRAEMPIIEYLPTIELNSWSYTKYNWKYRKSSAWAWEDVTNEPTIEELNTFYLISFVNVGLQTITLNATHGDLTGIFTPGFEFSTETSANNPTPNGRLLMGMFEVASSLYTGTQTIITTVAPFTLTEANIGLYVSPVVLTSNGDPWLGFYQHWALAGENATMPSNNRILNTPIYEEFTTVVSGITTFTLTSPNNSVAIYGSDSIRVYVNDKRVYTGFTEVLAGIYVGGVVFDVGVDAFTKVTVFVNAAAEDDAGREHVKVRTELNDFNFSTSGPEEVSLIRYRKTEQIKGQNETEYPYFNIYNMDGSFKGISPIWYFQESGEFPVESRVGLRVVTSDNGKVFYFEQGLLDNTTGEMYAYKDSLLVDIDNPNGLTTIWRIGTGAYKEYMPDYVDSERNTITVGNPLGDWEIPNQLFYNPLHKNKKVLSTSELLAHFKSIVDSQDVPWRYVISPNYGKGGTIKEHNYSYDTFLSSIFIKSTTPLQIIEFAQDINEKNINAIKANYVIKISDDMTNLSADYITNIESAIANSVINKFELNDAVNITYGDSNTYDQTTGLGIRGWIATLPFIRMQFKKQPALLTDGTLAVKEIINHDGSVSTYELAQTTITDTISAVLASAYPLGGLWGTTQASTPPTSMAVYNTFSGNAGKYWLDSNTDILYRFSAVSVGGSVPTASGSSLWFDTTSSLLKTYNGITWVPVNGVVNDITSAWKVIDIENILGQVLLTAENRLYDAAPTLTSLAYDISTLESDPNYNTYLEQAFIEHMKLTQIYNPYSADGYYNVTDAFTWNYKDVDVNNVNYPTSATQISKPWGSTWWDIYTKVFGTSYPHLEPWKLQGYTNKPAWWDSYYIATSVGRNRWELIMWTNIQSGIVPVGEVLPNNLISIGSTGAVEQYSHFCVDTITDELLPPYVSSSGDTLISNIGFIPNTIDSDYTFGEIGPHEWSWRKSSQHYYDTLKVAYRLQPVKFLHNTFGEKFYTVGGLQVDKRTNNVYSHTDAIFHGDMIDGVTFVVDGLNQWYTNYNRAKNLDNKVSDFRELWTGWDAKLTYQFDAFIDPSTLSVVAKNFFPKDNDYSVIIKKSEGAEDYWLDSLHITGTKKTRALISGDHADDWEFSINIPAPIIRDIYYYGVDTSSVDYTFVALNERTTSETWSHYAIDKNIINSALTPFTIVGMQNLINFIDGYSSYMKDQGFVFNDTDALEQDPDTNRSVSWQVEIERCIDAMYLARNRHIENNTVEVNPFRNNIWFRNERGIISNVVDGPYSSIRTENTLYDQYGRLLRNTYLHVYRQDSFGRVALMSLIPNDVFPTLSTYDFLHIGGFHLFIDLYEHVIMFNDYTTDGFLLYDSFLGLNNPRFLMQFNRQSVKVSRPNIGGFFLNDKTITRNIEGSVDDIALYYDTYRVNENSTFSKDARSVLGYDQRDVAYLDHLAVTDKSKLLFWKAMIQNKGSVNSINAFLNSIHFVDATVDEFWAYKVAEFGDADRKIYPEVKLNVHDIINDRILLQFTETTPATNFIQVAATDQERWYNWPNQTSKFVGTNLYFDAEVTSTLINPTPISGTIFKMDVICDNIKVVFDQGFVKNVSPAFSGTLLSSLPSYIVGADSLTVYVNGTITTDYVETSSTSITFNSSLVGATVVVIRNKGTLPANEIVRINSKLYTIPNYSSLGTFTIYTLNPAKTKLSPAKVIDYKANVVIDELPLWHPALGHHSPLAIHSVDFKRNTDPAKYSTTFNNTNTDMTLNYWGEREVGKIWWNTNNVGYLPYYDPAIFPSLDNRIRLWGALAEWVDLDVRQWVSSSVAPASWAGSGTPHKQIYKRVRDYDYFTIQPYALASIRINLETSGFGALDGTDATELASTDYNMQIILNNALITQQIINIVVKGTYAKTFNELIDEIKNDIPSTITVELLDNGIIFAATDPSVRTIDVVANEADTYDLLYSLTKNASPLYGVRFNIDQHVPSNKFIVGGDFTSAFTPGVVFSIYDASANNGTNIWTVSSSTYTNGGTLITVTTPVVTGSGGVIFIAAGVLSSIVATTVDSYLTLTADPCSSGITLTAGMGVFIKDTSGLPVGIEEKTKYYIVNNPNSAGQLLLSRDSAGTDTIQLNTAANMLVMNDSWTNAWVADTEEHAELNNFDGLNVSSINANIAPCDVVEVYLNGFFAETTTVDDFGILSVLSFSLSNEDTLHVVKKVHTLTDNEKKFDPSLVDDGTFLTQYHEGYEYVIRTLESDGITTSTYYFWVNDKIEVQPGKLMSVFDVANQLETIPTPYIIHQNLLSGYTTTDSNGQILIIPDYYDQVIIHGLAKSISSDGRYKLRFLQDFTLRDNYDDGKSALDLKNKHEEWEMFREKQAYKIRADLWSRMVEAMIGYTLNSFSTPTPVPVPSLTRKLYDDQYGTDTRFGLGEDQAFVDKTIAVNTVVAVIEDPAVDISPVDKDWFLNNYTFDNPTNIKTSMDYIYNSFGNQMVNKIFFEIMMDAFTSKTKYEEIMKTSWISLQGIQLLEIAGTAADDL